MRAAVHAVVAVMALLGAAASVASALETCRVAIKLSAPKAVAAGRKATASASVTNTAYTTLDRLYFKLELPDYMIPMAARASAFATKSSPPVLAKPYVYVGGARLPGRKTLRVKIAVGVPTCQAAGSV